MSPDSLIVKGAYLQKDHFQPHGTGLGLRAESQVGEASERGTAAHGLFEGSDRVRLLLSPRRLAERAPHQDEGHGALGHAVPKVLRRAELELLWNGFDTHVRKA